MKLLSGKCYKVQLWLANIAPRNWLVSAGNKPLLEPKLTQICVDISNHKEAVPLLVMLIRQPYAEGDYWKNHLFFTRPFSSIAIKMHISWNLCYSANCLFTGTFSFPSDATNVILLNTFYFWKCFIALVNFLGTELHAFKVCYITFIDCTCDTCGTWIKGIIINLIKLYHRI